MPHPLNLNCITYLIIITPIISYLTVQFFFSFKEGRAFIDSSSEICYYFMTVEHKFFGVFFLSFHS